MDLLLAVAPFALAFGLIASRRMSVARAGVVGAVVALAVLADKAGPAAAIDAAERGAWIAWMAISIIIAGLFFQKLALAAKPNVFAVGYGWAPGAERSRAFAAVFLLGVLVESASGFGLGAVAAAAVLRGAGGTSVRTAALALLSLSLVPWGALAIGTTIAGGLTGLPVVDIGLGSAVLSAPVLATALVLFWFWAPGGRAPLAMLAETLWLAALLALLWAANAFGAVEVAGVIAAGALFLARYGIDRLRRAPTLSAGPFALFALLIVAIRLVPGVTPALAELWSLAPWADLPAFAPFAHASFWLVAAGTLYALVLGLGPRRIGAEAGQALKAAATPTIVTLGFVILGEAMAATGAPSLIVAEAAAFSQAALPYWTPPVAALAGWLTGSNAAAHGMLVDLQAAVGALGGGAPLDAVVNQNVVASAFTMLSPMRVALVAAALGLAGREGDIAGRLFPFGLAVLGIAWAAIALG